MRVLRALALLVSICAAPTWVGATTWVIPETEEMLDTADAVVLATVSGMRSVAAPDGSGITTEVTLSVHEGYKGAVAGDDQALAGDVNEAIVAGVGDGLGPPGAQPVAQEDALHLLLEDLR